MIWIMLFSLIVTSVRDTASARKRGESVSLAQSFRANFKKMKQKLTQNFRHLKALLTKKLGSGPDLLTDS